MVKIKMLRTWQRHNEGDVLVVGPDADVPLGIADAYVRSGVARMVNDDGEIVLGSINPDDVNPTPPAKKGLFGRPVKAG